MITAAAKVNFLGENKGMPAHAVELIRSLRRAHDDDDDGGPTNSHSSHTSPLSVSFASLHNKTCPLFYFGICARKAKWKMVYPKTKANHHLPPRCVDCLRAWSILQYWSNSVWQIFPVFSNPLFVHKQDRGSYISLILLSTCSVKRFNQPVIICVPGMILQLRDSGPQPKPKLGKGSSNTSANFPPKLMYTCMRTPDSNAKRSSIARRLGVARRPKC